MLVYQSIQIHTKIRAEKKCYLFKKCQIVYVFASFWRLFVELSQMITMFVIVIMPKKRGINFGNISLWNTFLYFVHSYCGLPCINTDKITCTSLNHSTLNSADLHNAASLVAQRQHCARTYTLQYMLMQNYRHISTNLICK